MSALIYNGNTKVDMVLSLLKVKKGKIEAEAILKNNNEFGANVANSLSLEPSSIISLNITEGAEMFGIVGNITIDNKFNILEALDFTGAGSSGHELFMVLQVTDNEVEAVSNGKLPNGFKTLVTITNQQEASLNFTENVVSLNFEESAIHALKQISMEKVIGNHPDFVQAFNSLPKEFDILDLLKSLAVTPTLQKVYSNSLPKDSKTRGSRIYVSKHTPNTKFTHETATPVTPSMRTTNRRGEKSPSAYEFLKKMLSETLVDGSNRVPYLRMANVVEEDGITGEGIINRVFTFRPYVSDKHLKMMELIARPEGERKKVQHDMSEVYTEKFAFGPFSNIKDSDPNIKPHNQIEQFTTNKGHLQTLRDTVLADHNITSGTPDPGRVYSHTIILEATYLDFISREFPKLASTVGYNIPLFAADLINTIKIERASANTIANAYESELQQYNHIYSRISRALMNVVETVTFTANGLLMREPNKFIMIEQSGLNTKRNTANGELDNLYYVNNITHTFTTSDMSYKTRIQAGKWFGSTTMDDITDQAAYRMVDRLHLGLPQSPTGQTTTGIRLTGKPDENFVEDFTARADRYIEEEKLRRKKQENEAIGLTEDGTVPLGADGPNLDAKASTNETIQEIVGDYEKGQRPVIEKDLLLDYFDNLRKK